MSAPSPIRWMPAPLDVVLQAAAAAQEVPPPVPPKSPSPGDATSAAPQAARVRALAESASRVVSRMPVIVFTVSIQMEFTADGARVGLPRLRRRISPTCPVPR